MIISERKGAREGRGATKYISPPPSHTLFFVYVTYSAIVQKFDHVQGLFDVRDLLFEPTSPLRQVAVHIAVLPTEIIAGGTRYGRNVDREGERGRKSQKKARALSRDNANLWRYTHARASWNALRTLSTAASGPPRYSSTSFCGCGVDGWTDRWMG